MLLEIFEQPHALAQTIAHYVHGSALRDEAFAGAAEWLGNRSLVFAASGSSRHAALAAEIMLEDLSGVAVDVEYASEYAARSTHTDLKPAIAVVSQSGETADTLAALHKALDLKLPTLALTNVASSTMARQATVALQTFAGVERAIPATKSFTTQLLVLHLLSLFVARRRNVLASSAMATRLAELQSLPDRIADQLAFWRNAAQATAHELHSAETFLYLGRGVHYAIAREGALKLKESSYLQAEGYPAGELKHGPNALVSPLVPLVVLATVDRSDPDSVVRYTKTLNLLDDLCAQGATIVAIVNQGDEQAAALANYSIQVQPLTEYVMPIAEVVPLQLLAFCIAIQRGVDVDHPRNLVKAVTIE